MVSYCLRIIFVSTSNATDHNLSDSVQCLTSHRFSVSNISVNTVKWYKKRHWCQLEKKANTNNVVTHPNSPIVVVWNSSSGNKSCNACNVKPPSIGSSVRELPYFGALLKLLLQTQQYNRNANVRTYGHTMHCNEPNSLSADMPVQHFWKIKPFVDTYTRPVYSIWTQVYMYIDNTTKWD